jgi:hypothetical protein
LLKSAPASWSIPRSGITAPVAGEDHARARDPRRGVAPGEHYCFVRHRDRPRPAGPAQPVRAAPALDEADGLEPLPLPCPRLDAARSQFANDIVGGKLLARGARLAAFEAVARQDVDMAAQVGFGDRGISLRGRRTCAGQGGQDSQKASESAPGQHGAA